MDAEQQGRKEKEEALFLNPSAKHGRNQSLKSFQEIPIDQRTEKFVENLYEKKKRSLVLRKGKQDIALQAVVKFFQMGFETV